MKLGRSDEQLRLLLQRDCQGHARGRCRPYPPQRRPCLPESHSRRAWQRRRRPWRCPWRAAQQQRDLLRPAQRWKPFSGRCPLLLSQRWCWCWPVDHPEPGCPVQCRSLLPRLMQPRH